MKKSKWTKVPDSLEYRRTINGVSCVVRPVREPEKLTVWECIIHRPDEGLDVNLDVTTHPSHTPAMRHAEEHA